MIRKRQLQRRWSIEVRSADGWRCMNPWCPCRDKGAYGLSGHHIDHKSLGGLYDVENGITFCEVCHKPFAHLGLFKDDDGVRYSAREFVIKVLEYWKDKPGFRWSEPLKWLKKKRPLEV